MEYNIFKKRKKGFITITTAQRNSVIIQNSYKYDKVLFNMVVGGFMVGVGVVTPPLPTGSIFFIMFGVGLYNSPIRITTIYHNIKRKFISFVRGYI